MSTVETATPEAVNPLTEMGILVDEAGETSRSAYTSELLGPGQGIPFSWNKFMDHRYRAGTWAWVRHLWQRGGVVAQLGATANNATSQLWAGWELKKYLSGYLFTATFQNGPITRRSAKAKIFLELKRGNQTVGFRSVDAYPGSQTLVIYLRYEAQVDKIRAGALCEMYNAPSNAYAEVICDDIKVRRYSQSFQGLAADEGEELKLEGMVPSFDDDAVRSVSEEEKQCGEWAEFEVEN